MGMIPGIGGGGVPQFQRVLYVSPSFSGSSPTFNTIAGAYAACDGVTPTLIWVGPGTYVENLTAKENTWLVGLERESCVIDGGASAAVNLTMANAGRAFGFAHLSIGASGNNANSFGIAATCNADGILSIFDCNIGSFNNAANVAFSGLRFNTARSTAFVNLLYSTFFSQNLANQSCIQFPNGGNNWGTNFRIRSCQLLGSLNFNQQVSNLVIQDCQIDAALVPTLFAGTEFLIFDNCQFRLATSLMNVTAGAQITFQNCSFTNCQLTWTGLAGAFVFQSCHFYAFNNDQTFFSLSGGAGTVKLNDCSFQSGKILFSYVGTGVLVVVNTTIRNPGGALSIDSGANVMTFRSFNLTTDKALGANITVLAGGVNNNIAVNI